MKKLIAILLIFSLLGGNVSTAYAQLPGKFFRKIKIVKQLPAVQRTTSTVLHTSGLTTQVTRATRQALLGNTPKFTELRLRALQGRTSFLAPAILQHPITHERATLLRYYFPTAATEAAPHELTQAIKFWRTDLQENLLTLSDDTFYNTLADAAALGIFGTNEDLPILEKFYHALQNTPYAALAATVWTRALLVHQHYPQLAEFFAQHPDAYPSLQNGLAAYAQQQNLPLTISETSIRPEEPNSAPALEELGVPCRLAGDPSQTATALWVNLAHRTTPANTPKIARDIALTLPQNTLQAPGNLSLPAQEIPSLAANSATPLATPHELEVLPGAITPAHTTPDASKTPTRSQELHGGIALPALWNNAKKAFTKLKNLFRRKNTAQPSPTQQDGARTALQRFGIYMASYVMGLEVATPVIANFGSSFGLSLEENILVAVATYLPYSLGAFFSNWTKKVLGRKHSLNLGLAMMAGGLLAGVTFCGLNGAFIPQADTMLHFYKVLGCITVASLGGVLVHNSVGPIMTELSKNTSELVRQKRSAYTEFSRAVGMASSFAFPFIATKLLGMDWSLAFALPLPLIGAAALGVNLAKIPNTKPLTAAAPKAEKTASTGLINAIKNNEYIRLFKEEKGVGAFLSGLFIMNAVETAINSGFLFLLPSMTADPSSQYLFGLAQFAAPFLLGRYLASKFLQWFPKHNMSVATLMAGGGALASLAALDNVYALTAALFLAETGISTAFTLGFARTAKNPKTQDRVISLIVASAISAAFGPLLLTQLAQTMIDAGLLSAETATAAAMIGIPSGLAILSAMLFKRVENLGTATSSALKKMYASFKKLFKRPGTQQ